MSLRTQVIGIILLILLIPLIGLGGLKFWQKNENVPSLPIVKEMYLRQWINSHILLDSNGSIQIKGSQSEKTPFQVAIVNEKKKLIYSTIPDLNYSEQGGLIECYSRLSVKYPQYFLFLDPLTYEEVHTGNVLTIIPNEEDHFVNHLTLFYDLLTVFFITFIASALLISVWLRRLTKTVVFLRNHTELMAAGNWLTPIPLENVKPKEFYELGLTIEKLRGALVDESAKRYRLLSALSHDLKTPLTGIVGYLEALKDGLIDDPVERARYLDVIKRKTDALQKRLQALFQFAKMDSQPWKLTETEHDIGNFIGALATAFADDAQLLEKKFSFEGNLKGVKAIFDEVMMTRAIENIVSNAFRYTGSNGAVRLILRKDFQKTYIMIADNGPGIPENELSQIFEPFFRGSNNSKDTGKGLGLYIAKSILDGHSWPIKVFSELGKGTQFQIEIITLGE